MNAWGEKIGMCRLERSEKKGVVIGMGLKALSASRVEKLKSSMVTSRSRMKLWMIRATTSVLLWTCIVQLTALGDMWGPRVLKGWPSCFTQDSSAGVGVGRQIGVVRSAASPSAQE